MSHLRDRDRLLFHSFQQSLVLSSHLIEFVNTTDPLIAEDECPSLQREVVGSLFFHHCYGKTCSSLIAATHLDMVREDDGVRDQVIERDARV